MFRGSICVFCCYMVLCQDYYFENALKFLEVSGVLI